MIINHEYFIVVNTYKLLLLNLKKKIKKRSGSGVENSLRDVYTTNGLEPTATEHV